MPKGRGYEQAYALRDGAAAQAVDIAAVVTSDTREKLAKAQAFTSLVKAWEIASDRLRIMRGKPLPGSLRPEPKQRKQSAKWADVPPGAA